MEELNLIDMHDIEKLKDELITYPQGSTNGFTLIGPSGLQNIEYILNKVKEQRLEGDFIECGVWKGGACIFARALMDNLGIKGKVYVCDSFEGLPQPDELLYPADKGDAHYLEKDLAVSLEDVKSNFIKFGFKNDIVFIPGWFKDTLPKLKEVIKKVSVLRVDGDMYGSTINILENLYEKVIPGGYVIFDDRTLWRANLAMEDFRGRVGANQWQTNNGTLYWQK